MIRTFSLIEQSYIYIFTILKSDYIKKLKFDTHCPKVNVSATIKQIEKLKRQNTALSQKLTGGPTAAVVSNK